MNQNGNVVLKSPKQTMNWLKNPAPALDTMPFGSNLAALPFISS